MTPEEQARTHIDNALSNAGWAIVDRDNYQTTDNAVAVRELPTKGNLRTDYTLLLAGKAIAIIEAKKEDTDISNNAVSEQVVTYAKLGPKFAPAWQNPIPFLYKSNGHDILFQDYRKTQTDWVTLSSFPTPYTLAQLLNIPDPFAGLPALSPRGLRQCQYEAIKQLEKHFRNNHDRALVVLATGAGKTFTACNFIYRLLAHTPFRHVLFLVDRNNLAQQAEAAFASFKLTDTADPFNVLYNVERLKSSSNPSNTNVLISTIQRLFALLRGDAIDDADNQPSSNPDAPVTLPSNPSLPRDFFDLIIIDECHRSIYGNWKAVLDYFNTARLVGLTATPTPEALAFFGGQPIVNYSLEDSIRDGINVDCRIYRIRTKATEEGGTINKGDKTRRTTLFDGSVETVKFKEPKDYSPQELNRSVINPAQIRLILQTYRDKVYSELFNDPQRDPDMRYLPKTLIFALNENHASNIADIARQVFKPALPDGTNMDQYVQKITYSAADSNDLIRHFRNDRDFRIAVTCTLVATGTDVKPLEVLIFMRDVASETLYVQMKGRGVRTINDDALRNVTPNAFSKDFFFLIDAVGVTEHEKIIPQPGGGGGDDEFLTLAQLLERITHGIVPDEYLRRLASTLARINTKADPDQRLKFQQLALASMQTLAQSIFDALPTLPPYIAPSPDSPANINEQRKTLVAHLTDHAPARKYLLVLNAGFVNTLTPGEDELIYTGFSLEEATSSTQAFENYCRDHADDIEALRIIYHKQDLPITYQMLKDLQAKLLLANNLFSSKKLWNAYATLQPAQVRRNNQQEANALTNIIQLVRFALQQTNKLECVSASTKQYFNLWCGQKQLALNDAQRNIMSQIVSYIAANGACSVADIKNNDRTQAAQLIQAFHNPDNANFALNSLFKFVVLRNTAA